MPSGPLVSVITPAYRARGLIAEAAQSLIGQTYPNWEMIVVSDDGSDYCPVLPEDSRISQVFTRGIATGPGAARNAGLVHAKGEFVAHLDADDYFLPERIGRLLPLAMECGGAIDNMRILDHARGCEITRLFDAPGRRLGFCEAAGLNFPLFPLYRRELVGRWDEDIDFAEDVLFNLRAISRIGGLALCGETLMAYRVRAGSLSCSADSGARAEAAYAEILGRLEGGGLDFPPEVFETVKRVFLRKAELNRAFVGAGRAESFAEYAARLDAKRELPQNSGCN